jgi:hypothetical protein
MAKKVAYSGKNNTAILDTHTKLIKFMFNNEEFEVDIKEGDIEDSWNAIEDKKGVLWDFNFTWESEEEEAYLCIYGLTPPDEEGYQSTNWNEDTSIKIVEIVGNASFYFNNKDFEFNHLLPTRFEVFNEKDELQLKTKKFNKACDTTSCAKLLDGKDGWYFVAIDSNGARKKLG